MNWNSSSTSIATINSAGLATGGIAGLDVIPASLGNVAASVSLSVGHGTVSGPETVTCGSGFASKSQCTQAMVSCPGTADLLFTYGVKQGTGGGVIVIYNGAAGIIAGGTSYVTAFNGAGFTTVQVAWASNWQDIGLTTKNILTAACRPATVGQYLHSILYSSGGFGVLGGSAGAGAVGYWLSWYNGENLLDNAELASGPVYSDIEQGCEVPIANPVTIVPTNGTPWTDEPNYRGGPQNGPTTETGYTCQPKGGSSFVTDAAWLSQCIVQSGWISAFPQTSIAGWVCNNAINNSEAEGWIFYSQLATPYSLTAISSCPDSETVDNGLTPQGVLDLPQ